MTDRCLKLSQSHGAVDVILLWLSSSPSPTSRLRLRSTPENLLRRVWVRFGPAYFSQPQSLITTWAERAIWGISRDKSTKSPFIRY